MAQIYVALQLRFSKSSQELQEMGNIISDLGSRLHTAGYFSSEHATAASQPDVEDAGHAGNFTTEPRPR